jgi:hypothetical protein
MLASQAAVALANVRFAAGLERKVAERTTELEQRAASSRSSTASSRALRVRSISRASSTWWVTSSGMC